MEPSCPQDLTLKSTAGMDSSTPRLNGSLARRRNSWRIARGHRAEPSRRIHSEVDDANRFIEAASRSLAQCLRPPAEPSTGTHSNVDGRDQFIDAASQTLAKCRFALVSF